MKLQAKIEALALIEAGIRALDQLDTEKVDVEAMEWVAERYERIKSEIVNEIKDTFADDIRNLVVEGSLGGLVN